MIFPTLFLMACAISACSGDISEGAAPGFVPYHVGVYSKSANLFDPNRTDYTFLCSGALLGANAVLTTATCLENALSDEDAFAVLAGFVDRFDEDVVFTEVQEARRHEDHVEGDKANDLAVLKLGVGLTLSDNVRPIEVRASSPVAVGALCTLSGWRKDLLTLSPVLRYSNVHVLDNSECHEAGDGELCAGAATEADRVGCQLGDEGSPVSCEFVLTGLMHYSVDTCLSEPEPGVFGDVLPHAAWIQTQLAAAESVSSTTSTSSPAASTPTVTTTTTPGYSTPTVTTTTTPGYSTPTVTTTTTPGYSTPTVTTTTTPGYSTPTVTTTTTPGYSTPTVTTTTTPGYSTPTVTTTTTPGYSTPTVTTTTTPGYSTPTVTTTTTPGYSTPTASTTPGHPTGVLVGAAGTPVSSLFAVAVSALVAVVVLQ